MGERVPTAKEAFQEIREVVSDTRARIRLAGEATFESLVRTDWVRVASDLNESGSAILENLLSPQDCERLAARYASDDGFRSRVVMSRHGFGKGRIQIFLIPVAGADRGPARGPYPPLAAIANDWNARMGLEMRYPPDHADFLALCHKTGQSRPTPLLLQYGPGDYNCLHQDLYGDLAFPLQVTILLSEPGRDFSGGEFVITEQRPRMPSRADVVPLRQGNAVIFAVHHRPARGTRGDYRVNLRHGVSRIRSGHRHTVGIIFHDAR